MHPATHVGQRSARCELRGRLAQSRDSHSVTIRICNTKFDFMYILVHRLQDNAAMESKQRMLLSQAQSNSAEAAVKLKAELSARVQVLNSKYLVFTS